MTVCGVCSLCGLPPELLCTISSKLPTRRDAAQLAACSYIIFKAVLPDLRRRQRLVNLWRAAGPRAQLLRGMRRVLMNSIGGFGYQSSYADADVEDHAAVPQVHRLVDGAMASFSFTAECRERDLQLLCSHGDPSEVPGRDEFVHAMYNCEDMLDHNPLVCITTIMAANYVPLADRCLPASPAILEVAWFEIWQWCCGNLDAALIDWGAFWRNVITWMVVSDTDLAAVCRALLNRMA